MKNQFVDVLPLNHYYSIILLLKQSRILNLTENLDWALENADMLTTTYLFINL